MSESSTIEFDGEQISLAQIADLDMDQVQEVRFEDRPAGLYHMCVEDATLTVLGKDKPKAAVVVKCEVANCMNLVAGGDPAGQVGKKHRETFFMGDGDGIGRLKAFLVDTGFKGTGTLTQLLEQFHGHEFDAIIKHTKDKNDTDRVYVNFASGKVKPHAVA